MSLLAIFITWIQFSELKVWTFNQIEDLQNTLDIVPPRNSPLATDDTYSYSIIYSFNSSNGLSPYFPPYLSIRACFNFLHTVLRKRLNLWMVVPPRLSFASQTFTSSDVSCTSKLSTHILSTPPDPPHQTTVSTFFTIFLKSNSNSSFGDGTDISGMGRFSSFPSSINLLWQSSPMLFPNSINLLWQSPPMLVT